MTRTHTKHADVVALLRRTPMTVEQLAARLGISRVAVRGHLHAIRQAHTLLDDPGAGGRFDRVYRVVVETGA